MAGKEAVNERAHAAEQLLEAARALCPLGSALASVYRPQHDIPANFVELLKRFQ